MWCARLDTTSARKLSYVSFEAYNEIQEKGTSKNNLKYKVAYALLQMNGINNKC